MIVDNCPAHPHVTGLTNVELIFLPPNTTSHTQPMDQGVIQNLKVHYQKHIIVRHLATIDKKTEVKLSVLDALRFLKLAWDNVSVGTINHCFRHAGFINTTESANPEYESDPYDDVPLSHLVTNGVTLMEYARADDSLVTCAPISDNSIVEEVLAARTPVVAEPEPESDTENDDTADIPPPSLTSATEALSY
ncbi:tigger transposable element-derived protein 4-like [Gigantopelta aegis]|uniref:tigger transposable element-derived protein 4-like n=1 Tax=Gigantopelta aegis TaxID=1735272 RepID=UPI001B889295|nr:tigger transposable element-derived protein 4-like [Gigantopelta aegis]